MKDALDVITGTTDGKTSVSGARWAVGIACATSLILGSMYTRSRAASGATPIFGILF